MRLREASFPTNLAGAGSAWRAGSTCHQLCTPFTWRGNLPLQSRTGDDFLMLSDHPCLDTYEQIFLLDGMGVDGNALVTLH